MPKIETTNMVMVQDSATGKVIVQRRVKSWCGIAFPGDMPNREKQFMTVLYAKLKKKPGLMSKI